MASATSSREAACARALLEAGADPNLGNDVPLGSPLAGAIARGEVPMVKLLLSAGAEVNRIWCLNHPDYSTTPLHKAITGEKNHSEVMEILIKEGAAVNARDWADETPLESAITISRIPRVRSRHRLYPILLRSGANLPHAGILSEPIWRAGEAYVKRVMDAGSFAAYERRHVNALAATFGPKLGLLPEIARVVVAFAFHCGYY